MRPAFRRLENFGDDRGARTDKADASAREGDLGRRGKGHHAVLGTRRASEVKDVCELVGLVVQVVHAVGVVPEDAEIGRGRGHLDQAAHSVPLKVMPVGLEYLGTHQIPLMESSAATRRSTSSMSGPLSVIATGTFSIPRSAVMPKWRS